MRCRPRTRRAGRIAIAPAHRNPGRYPLLDHGQKYYEFLIFGGKLVFREQAIGNAHIFPMACQNSAVICDQEFKDACKVAGLKRIWFRDVLKI
ncbi:imm11 family protein [Bradyrhizobium sp. NC92]|uniref:imm11 family protein n=1 Tax=Bradyrhizobium sp. (strain NC92) TaxID=55395 RepID=UPI0039068B54